MEQTVFAIWIGKQMLVPYRIHVNHTMSEIYRHNKKMTFVIYIYNIKQMKRSFLSCDYEPTFMINNMSGRPVSALYDKYDEYVQCARKLLKFEYHFLNDGVIDPEFLSVRRMRKFRKTISLLQQSNKRISKNHDIRKKTGIIQHFCARFEQSRYWNTN